jgi:hypothetical protein
LQFSSSSSAREGGGHASRRSWKTAGGQQLHARIPLRHIIVTYNPHDPHGACGNLGRRARSVQESVVYYPQRTYYLFRTDEPLDAVPGDRDARGRHSLRNRIQDHLPKDQESDPLSALLRNTCLRAPVMGREPACTNGGRASGKGTKFELRNSKPRRAG